jgi:2'-5' RNA ligase
LGRLTRHLRRESRSSIEERPKIKVAIDQGAEERIEALRTQIEAAGVSTAYKTPLHNNARIRPHITLGGYNVDRPEDWDEPLRELAAARQPFPVLLHALGLFVEAGVVYLAPRISAELLTVRDDVLTFFDQRSVVPRSPNFHPDRFNPHCTLVPQSTGDETIRAIEVCRRNWQAIDATATGLCMIAPPETDRMRYSFGA